MVAIASALGIYSSMRHLWTNPEVFPSRSYRQVPHGERAMAMVGSLVSHLASQWPPELRQLSATATELLLPPPGRCRAFSFLFNTVPVRLQEAPYTHARKEGEDPTLRFAFFLAPPSDASPPPSCSLAPPSWPGGRA